MNKLFSLILVLGIAACLVADDSAKAGGNWTMSWESPHGMLQSTLRIQQDGSKLSGTVEMQPLGTLPLTGKVEGNKVSFEVRIEEHNVSLMYTGTIEGDKMSGTMKPQDRPWTATRQ